jgi:trigger factor
MKTRVEEIGPCRRTLRVDVGWDEVEGDYRDLVKGYAAVVALPGFRKGKAPVNIVELRLASHLDEDARERFVPKFYRVAVEAEKLQPVAVVKVDDVHLVKNEGFGFRATIDVAPRVNLPKYRKLSVKKVEPIVTEADVEEAIQSLRGRLARYEDVTGRACREGDLVRIDYSGSVDGRPLSELDAGCAGLGQGTDFLAMLGQASDFLPGISEKLAGMNVGETRTVRIGFQEDFNVPAVAGKEAQYTVTLKAIRERVLPPLDEALLSRVGVESEQALRERARSELREAAEHRALEVRRGEIANFLLEKTPFEPPESLLEHESRQVFIGTVRSMVRQGVTNEELVRRREQIGNQSRQMAAQRIRMRFILLAIAAEEHLALTDEEFDQHIAGLAAHMNQTPEKLAADLQSRDEMDSAREDALCEKTMNRLMEMTATK